MTEWEKYTGSDEQIAEIDRPFIFKDINGVECNLIKRPCDFISSEHLKNYLDNCQAAEILVIQHDPLREMTGQPVWARARYESSYIYYSATTRPDWNIPNAEYSFASFEEEV